ncbi:hypothetical protein ACWGN9_23155 [Streptomyces sp. NPDC055775]
MGNPIRTAGILVLVATLGLGVAGCGGDAKGTDHKSEPLGVASADPRVAAQGEKPVAVQLMESSGKKTLPKAYKVKEYALRAWFESGLEPLGIHITRMNLGSDSYIHIYTDCASGDPDGGHHVALSTMESYHEDDAATTFKDDPGMSTLKGVKVYYSDGTRAHEPEGAPTLGG